MAEVKAPDPKAAAPEQPTAEPRAAVAPLAINSTYVLTRYDSDRGDGMMGKIVFDATTIVATDFVEVNCGFKPRYVKVVNITDRIACEYFVGMADNTCVKLAANGAGTLEVVGITLTNRGFRVSQNAGLALIAASKTLHFIAAP